MRNEKSCHEGSFYEWSRGDLVLLPRFRSLGFPKNGDLVIFPFCDRILGRLSNLPLVRAKHSEPPSDAAKIHTFSDVTKFFAYFLS